MTTHTTLLSQLLGLTSIVLAASHTEINLPLGNPTALNTEIAPLWVSEPNFRGTWRLLYSCVFTLTLCVYSSIHLNVPRKGERLWPYYRRKAKWVLIAILTPEIALFTAYTQFFTARKLYKELNSLLDKQVDVAEVSADRREHQGDNLFQRKIPMQPRYDIVFGYYATMGGFVVDVDEYSNRFSQLTITPLGVIALARKGHFLSISNDSIEDKSKADLFAKGMVLFQVLWMVVQCIARVASGYPLAVLEVHTIVHIVCAMLMYALWFYKPLDIKDPTLVDMSGHMDSLAVLLAYTNYSCYRNPTESQQWSRWRQDANHFIDRDRVLVQYEMSESAPRDRPAPSDENSISFQPPDPAGQWSKPNNQYPFASPAHISTVPVASTIKAGTLPLNLPPSIDIAYRVSYKEFHDNGIGLGWYNVQLELSSKDIRRWNLIAGTISNIISQEKDGTKDRQSLRHGNDEGYDRISDIFKIHTQDDFLVSRACNYTYQFFLSNELDIKSAFTSKDLPEYGPAKPLAIAAILSAIYGGTHLSAWNFALPTRVEDIMWKASCFESIFGIMIPALGYLVHKRVDGIYSVWAMPLALFNMLGFFMGLMFLPLWLCSRFFIVVESFISLRHVPVGVYASVPWADLIPHF